MAGPDLGTLKDIQDNFLRKELEALQSGTPMHQCRIIQKILRQIRKTMDKDENNLCMQALIAGQKTGPKHKMHIRR